MTDQPRIAIFSPLNPVRSGISDYTETLLSRLQDEYRIDVFIEAYVPRSEWRNVRCRHCRDFEWMNKKDPYSLVVYQIGNHECHQYMYHVLFRHPGIVFLHETNLHRARALAFLKTGQLREYFDEMKYCHGDEGEKVGWLIARGFDGDLLFDRYPMLNLVTEAASGLIVHNEYSAGMIRRMTSDVPVHVVPAPYIDSGYHSREEARQILGIPSNEFVITSFGFVNAGKGLESSIEACIRFMKTHAESRYILVGESQQSRYLKTLYEKIPEEMKHRIQVTGFVSVTEFSDYLAAGDVCINLRYPSQGESSSTLLRIMGAGKPVLVPAYRQFLEFPKDTCIHVELSMEIDFIHATLIKLFSDPEICRRIGQAGRRFVEKNHSVDRWISKIREVFQHFFDSPDRRIPLSQRSSLGHVRTMELSQQIALTLYEWQDMARHPLTIDSVTQKLKEFGFEYK